MAALYASLQSHPSSLTSEQHPSLGWLSGPLHPFIDAWTHRKLIWRLASREVQARYRGSLLGLGWSIIVPFVLLAVYTFVFSVVFQARWGAVDGSLTHFATRLFCGLIVFNFFSECLSRAPGLILSNPSYVKKVVFPLEILPWVSAVSAMVNACLAAAVLLLAFCISEGPPPLSILAAPLVMLPTIFLTLGLSLFLSSLGVFLRDLQQLIGILLTVLMFMSPLFYPIDAIPEAYRGAFSLSPLTISITEMREILFDGSLPSPIEWLINLGASWLVLWLGFLWFTKTRKGFADVL